MTMKRRDMLTVTGVGAAAAALAGTSLAQAQSPRPGTRRSFKLKYAPHFGMFKNHAPGGLVDELKFAADHGFAAWEDNNMKRRPVAEQELLAREMQRLGITMGVFVAHVDFENATFNSNKPEARERVLKDIQDSVEVAKRVNARWATVVPGKIDLKVEEGFQTAWCIDNLRRAAEICEKANLVMVLEPLNWWANHPGLFLRKIPQAFEICRAVNSPACKILFDAYHQQIQEGNLIPNIDTAYSEVAYFQVGDNPGRKEPGTGEVNYRNVFRHIQAKGFAGVVGMEHGNSQDGKAGELAVIAAYREADNFKPEAAAKRA